MTNRGHYATAWKCLPGDPVLSLCDCSELTWRFRSFFSSQLHPRVTYQTSLFPSPATQLLTFPHWLDDSAPSSASLTIRQVLQARYWHQLCPGWQLGWFQRVGMSGHSPTVWVQREVLFMMLWKEEIVRELLPCLSLSICLNALLNSPKHQAKAKQVDIPISGL